MNNQKENVLYLSINDKNIDEFKLNFQKIYNLFIAKSSIEAIELLHDHPIAVVIAEQNLGDLTGVQFLEAILSEFPDTVRMLINDSDDAEALIQAINKAHVFRSFTLPWDTDELKQSIDNGIKIYRLEQRNRSYINQLQQASLKSERLLNFFRKCVPEHIANEAATNSESLFTIEKREITVLYIRMENINELIKKAPIEKTLLFLKEYLQFASKHIEQHKGTINKLIGGNIVALFGAPISYLHNPLNAVFAAFAITEGIKKLNADISDEIHDIPYINIGIHSGPAIVGNIGSREYIAYTAIGEPINQAMRLTTINQPMHFAILVSDTIYHAVKEEINFEKIKINNQESDIYKALEKKVKIGI